MVVLVVGPSHFVKTRFFLRIQNRLVRFQSSPFQNHKTRLVIKYNVQANDIPLINISLIVSTYTPLIIDHMVLYSSPIGEMKMKLFLFI